MEQSDISISYARPSDIKDILDLWRNAGVFNPDEDKESILEKVINYDSQAICVLKLNNKIVGSCMIIYHPFQTFIYRFGIHTDYQNLGLGTKLSDFIDETLKNKGMLHPTLFVEEGNDIGNRFWCLQGWDRLYKVDCYVKNLEQ